MIIMHEFTDTASGKVNPRRTRTQRLSIGQADLIGCISMDTSIRTSQEKDDMQVDIVMDSEMPADEPESDKDSEDDDKDKKWLAPGVDATHAAHGKLDMILHPWRKDGKGHLDPNLDLLLQSYLEAMKCFLWNYTNSASLYYGKWCAASLDTATSSEKGPWFAHRLHEWSSTFIIDAKALPFNVYGT